MKINNHVDPLVKKAYKNYIEAKKNGDAEKEYRYYSRKLNNTYSTINDRREIESILKEECIKNYKARRFSPSNF